MPASEQVWYNPKVMHVVFGIASVVMLIATVWMLAEDHLREWKEWQLEARKIESWTLTARVNGQQTVEYEIALQNSEAALAAARSAMIEADVITRFKEEAHRDSDRRGVKDPGFNRLDENYEILRSAIEKATSDQEDTEGQQPQTQQAAADARADVLGVMQDFVNEARLREDNLSRETKFTKADLTAKVSMRDIAVGGGVVDEVIASYQTSVDAIKIEVADLTADLDAAKDHRLALEAFVKSITAEEEEAQKKLEELQADLALLHTTLSERSTNMWEWLIRQPVLDALYTGDIGIEQIWLPELTIDYNFQDVARFDRCITCHRAINKTAPGSSVAPAYKPEEQTTVTLTTPSAPPKPVTDAQGDPRPVTLADAYGFSLATEGRVHWDDVTIEYVWPEKAGIQAGLVMGDVIEYIGDTRINTREQVEDYLLGRNVAWGEPLVLKIRRGVPHPFSSHPRMDLFIGSLSPHKQAEIGCTICHDGQGSATAFKWASHSPNDMGQAHEWFEDHGWFDNHHWIYPMRPKRFVESGCLKCHHEVTDLEPSERFPDPPAPKLLEGYNLIRQFGCYGCHEINGYDGPNRRIGPDLRAEPNFFAAAHSLLSEVALSEQERGWAQHLVKHPEDDAVRRRLWEAIDSDQILAGNPQTKDQARFAAKTHKLGILLKDIESPGTLPKPGPSLRFLSSKVDFSFLYSWIRKPSDFRPSTRMPQFFGQWQHLDGGSLAAAERFEPIEIRAIAHYLLKESKPFEYLSRPAGVTEEPSAERGKALFETRGCLACHSHVDFPAIAQDQGPDLSRVGAKLNTPKGQKWLYSWIKQPNRYHARTMMPNLFLDPIAELDALGKPNGKVTDPAADITAYLLGSADWQATNVPSGSPTDLSAEEQEALTDLALEWLAASFPKRRAAKYLEEGIPESMASSLKSAERQLLGLIPANRIEKQLDYVGFKTISKYGCFGCHDIPSFEDAKPIGTALADWGRKDASKLAFELIGSFLAHNGINGDGNTGHGDGHAGGGGHGHGLSPEDFDPDTGFFLHALNGHRREGFIWQKLRMPRSYDYQKTENKGYNEQLRMPKFPIDAKQREAIITFVLGLVSEPPAAQYIYKPDSRQKAIIEGRKVLDKYNCAGCHTLRMERWEFDYHADEFGGPPSGAPDYPFLEAHFTPPEIVASQAVDQRGLQHATVYGMPQTSEEDGQPILIDDEGTPLEQEDLDDGIEPFYSFALWRHAPINGNVYKVGGPNLLVRKEGVKQYPAWGGTLARYLFPKIIAAEKQVNPQVKGSEAWSWLPPPLVGEGQKVQPDWLYDFLLDPSRIRPAAVMRMPNFHMSPDESRKLVDYFAAVDGANYPYEFDVRRSSSYSLAMKQEQPGRLAGALGIVLDRNFCVTCHLVGDFQPEGRATALAPNLDQVYRRLRPDFVRRWIANPTRILPYTGMPVNIPYQGGIDQKIFPGTSTDQLDALVDFLMNYDLHAEQQMSIKSQVKPAAPLEAQPAE